MNAAAAAGGELGSGDAVLQLRDVRRAFGERQVLRGLSLQVRRGELLGLVGPNGAGKSTLFRTLVGLVQRDGGTIDVLGLDPGTDGLAVRQRVSYLPGEAGVYLQMTGQQYLDFTLGFYPRLDAERRRRLLAAFDLPLRQRVRGYSAGMKQKLALCASLIPDVDVYVLDEPDRALDASVRFQLREVLRDLRAAGKTIVLSSHHLGEIEALADRLEFLLHGTLVPPPRLLAARAELRQRPRLRLRPGHALPAGARELAREADGTLVVATTGDPLQWLQRAPADAIESIEIGLPRLEDLYQLLLHDHAAATGAAT